MSKLIDDRRVIYTSDIAGTVAIYHNADGSIQIHIDPNLIDHDDGSVPNNAPIFVENSIGPFAAGILHTIDLRNYVVDPDGDELTFEVNDNELPSGMTFNSATGFISGTAALKEVVSFKTIVTDSRGSSTVAYMAISISENPNNTAPTWISALIPAAVVGQGYYYDLSANVSDADGDPITIAQTGALPAGMSFANNVLSGTPTVAAEGQGTAIEVTALDTQGGGFTIFVFLVVNAVDVAAPPVFSATALQDGETESFYSIDLSNYVSDPNGDLLTITVGTLPSWMVYDDVTTTLSGNPDTVTGYSIDVTADDGTSTTLQAMSLTINPSGTNSLPSWSTGFMPDAVIGEAYSFDLSTIASDADGGTLTFTEDSGMPSWATLTGSVIAGTPDVSTNHSIYLTVDDGQGGAVGTALELVVLAGAYGPEFTSTTLPNASQYDHYEYDLNGILTDPYGAGLTFVANSGMPSGLSLSTDGILSGIITSLQTDNINVTATDGANNPVTDTIALTTTTPAATGFPYAINTLTAANRLEAGAISNGDIVPSEWTLSGGAVLADANATISIPSAGAKAAMNSYKSLGNDAWYLLRFNIASDTVPHAAVLVEVDTALTAGGSEIHSISQFCVNATATAQEVLLPIYLKIDCSGMRFSFQQDTNVDAVTDSAITITEINLFNAQDTRKLGGLSTPSGRKSFDTPNIHISPLGEYYVNGINHMIKGVHVNPNKVDFANYADDGFNTALNVANVGDALKAHNAGMKYFWDFSYALVESGSGGLPAEFTWVQNVTTFPAKSVPSYPAYLAEVPYPTLNTVIKRIGDRAYFDANMSNLYANDDTQLRHQYAHRQVWNSDGTYMIFSGGWRWTALLDGDGNFVREILASGSDRLWSNTEPNFIYAIDTDDQTNFVKVNVTNDAETLVKSFGFTLSMGDTEGDISLDDTRICFNENLGSSGVRVHCLQIDTGATHNFTIPRNSADFDWVSVSPDGSKVVIAYDGDTYGSREVNVYSWAGTFERTLCFQQHGDMGKIAGNDVWFTVGHNQGSGTTAAAYRLSDGQKTVIFGDGNEFPNGGSNGVLDGHISASATRYGVPIVIISSYSSSSGPHVVFSVSTDGLRKVRYYGFHNTLHNEYLAQTQANCNRTGDKVIFASNWNGTQDAVAYLAYDPNGSSGGFAKTPAQIVTDASAAMTGPRWASCIGYMFKYDGNATKLYDRIVDIVTLFKAEDSTRPVMIQCDSPYLAIRFNTIVDALAIDSSVAITDSDTVSGEAGRGYAFPHAANLLLPTVLGVIDVVTVDNLIRDNIFNAIAHGLKGFSLDGDSGNMETAGWWAAMLALNTELEVLRPIINNNHQAPFLIESSTNEARYNVAYGAFVYEGIRYLCIANDALVANSSQTATIDVVITDITDASDDSAVSTPDTAVVPIPNATQMGRMLKLDATTVVVVTAPVFTSSTLPTADEGESYSYNLENITSDNGPSGRTVTISNTPPAGLTITDGVLSGTPTVNGSFTLDARVTNDTNGMYSDAVLTLNITASGGAASQQYGDGTLISEDFIVHELDIDYVSGSGSPSYIESTDVVGSSNDSYLEAVGVNSNANKSGMVVTVPLSDLPAGNHKVYIRNMVVDTANSQYISFNDVSANAVYFNGANMVWDWRQQPYDQTITSSSNSLKFWVREPMLLDKVIIVPDTVTSTPTGRDGFTRLNGEPTYKGPEFGGGTIGPIYSSTESLTDIAGHYINISGSGNQASQNAGKISQMDYLVQNYPYDAVNKTGPRGILLDRRWDWSAAAGVEATNEEAIFIAANGSGHYVQTYFKDIAFALSNNPSKNNYATPYRSFAPSSMENAGETMVTGNPSNLAASAKLHLAPVMDKYIAAVKTFHDKYKHHASYRGVTVPETSRAEFTGSDLTNENHFTNLDQAFSTQYKRMVTELATYMAPHILNVQINFFGSYLSGTIAHCMQYANVEFGTPDFIYRYDPQNPAKTSGSKTLEILNYMRQYNVTNWIAPHEETREISTDTSDVTSDLNDSWKLAYDTGYDADVNPQSIFHYNWHPRPSIYGSWRDIVLNKCEAENWYHNAVIPTIITQE